MLLGVLLYPYHTLTKQNTSAKVTFNRAVQPEKEGDS